MRVLVAGGAGYIGSHTVVALLEAGHEPIIADDFSNSSPAVLPRLKEITGRDIETHEINLTDGPGVTALFEQVKPDAVIHFAGFKAVGESVEKPLEYYSNNLSSTFALLEAMRTSDCNKFVFSSSATVYGEGAPLPYHEDYRPLTSTNPYGWTKAMIEQIVTDFAKATPGFKSALLRYFNPIGAHSSGLIGEDPSGIPNNLMPYIAQVAVGRREKLNVFGDDYDTSDGTGERDYIHVVDLAAGHVAALEHLDDMAEAARPFNLGTGQPTSVLELVHAFERACGKTLPYEIVARRAGDLATTYADPHRAESELGWKATKSIDDMCADTWRWQSTNPNGFAGD